MNILKNTGVICALALVMVNTDVAAQSGGVQRGGSYPPAELTSRVEILCSEQSIKGSENAETNAKRQAQQAMNSALTPPAVRMQARIDLSLRVLSKEMLITNCAIIKALSPGV